MYGLCERCKTWKEVSIVSHLCERCREEIRSESITAGSSGRKVAGQTPKRLGVEEPRIKKEAGMTLINCPECGREVSDKAASCPQCGYPIANLSSGTAGSAQASPRQAPASSFQSGRPICPLCGNDYSIAKVSAIYGSQTSTYRSSGSGTASTPLTSVLAGQKYHTHNISVGSVTSVSSELAKKLAPPVAPEGLGGTRPFNCLFMVVAIISGVVIVANADKLGLDSKSTSSVFVVGGLMLAIMLVGPILEKPSYDRDKARYRSRLERWKTFYYCQKHDIVFVPGEPRSYPPDQMNTLLGG